MKRRSFIALAAALLTRGQRANGDVATPKFKVALRDAHKGTLDIDTQLLDSYGGPPAALRQFYLDARKVFSSRADADFSDEGVIEAARKNQVALLGGPMLGQLNHEGVTIWTRPASTDTVTVNVGGKSFSGKAAHPGAVLEIPVTGLSAETSYDYALTVSGEQHKGSFLTASVPDSDSSADFRIAFGSCCHKIGIHNPNLFGQIRKRRPHAMMLLGDIAVDDRNDEVNMHRCDYQLRDVSTPWRDLAANVPLFASWDDHDYFDNDLSGIPKRYKSSDRDNVRAVYRDNWNNPIPDDGREGIYFSHRMGPVEIIMLDTRSCRDGKRRNSYGAYLGEPQMEWLKATLRESTAPFKVISSGTMWSDYVSKAKDSWGSWDKEGREEIFSLIEKEKIGGVLLVSGDRHGARAFRIPRPSGFSFHEFEPATLGGVSGPGGIVKDCKEQLFGYNGGDLVACGEFTFGTGTDDPHVTFRLIRETGEILEEHRLSLDALTPA